MLRIVQRGRYQLCSPSVQALCQTQIYKSTDVTEETSKISTNPKSTYIREAIHTISFLPPRQTLTNQILTVVNNANGGAKFPQSRLMSTESVRAVTEDKLQDGSPRPNFDLTFDDFKTAFSNKSKWELIRALAILWVCSFDFVANHSLKIMWTSKKLLGQTASQWLLKRLVYEQFVAGETVEEIQTVVAQLQSNHVGPLLAAPMEDDINTCHDDADKKFDANLETILSGMALARELDPQYPMTQLRMTGLMPGDACAFLSQRCPEPSTTPEVIQALASALRGHPIDIQQTFGGEIPDAMEHHLRQAVARVAKVCQMATSEGVIVMVDAEYTYLNPALSLFTLAMMSVCNDTARTSPLIFNTYQNYLKTTRTILDRDLQWAHDSGIGFGAKLVRGAYMVKERKLAKTSNYPDPVQDTFDDTSRAYDAAVTTFLGKIAAKPRQYRVIVASHNEKSVLAAVQGIQQMGIDPRGGSVFFGQIMGMADHISYNLAMNGFLARKSIPYGPVVETLPYLSRRAQENRAVFHGARRERSLLKSELRHRFRLGAA